MWMNSWPSKTTHKVPVEKLQSPYKVSVLCCVVLCSEWASFNYVVGVITGEPCSCANVFSQLEEDVFTRGRGDRMRDEGGRGIQAACLTKTDDARLGASVSRLSDGWGAWWWRSVVWRERVTGISRQPPPVTPPPVPTLYPLASHASSLYPPIIASPTRPTRHPDPR